MAAILKDTNIIPRILGSLSDNRVWNITEDSSNRRLWVGTLGGGLDLFDERSKRFVHHRSGDFNSVDSDFILALIEDQSGEPLDWHFLWP
jgi:hypothetical protein